MPNCIFIPTPKSTIKAIIDSIDINNKVVYEPGCGNGDFLKACLIAGAKHVYGSEPNADLDCHKMNKLANATIYCQKHEEVPEYSLKGIDYVYCYLMHGMTESIVESLLGFNKKFTLISLNYPIPFWRDSIIPIEPSIRIQHEVKTYPPYSLIYNYQIEEGKLTNKVAR